MQDHLDQKCPKAPDNAKSQPGQQNTTSRIDHTADSLEYRRYYFRNPFECYEDDVEERNDNSSVCLAYCLLFGERIQSDRAKACELINELKKKMKSKHLIKLVKKFVE